MKKFAKLVDGKIEFAPINFGEYLNFNLNEELMKEHGYKEFVAAERPEDPYYAIKYEETEDSIIEKIVISEEDAEKNEEVKREMKDRKELTPSDVERALYKSAGVDFEDVKKIIAEKLPQVDMKAIGIEFRASSFFRGATLGDGTRLFDVIGALLGYTPKDIDELFETKELPKK